MANPLAKTFDLLASTKAGAAVELLVAALDSRYPAIQDKAVAALLRRGATRCQTEVIRRISKLTPTGTKCLEDQGSKLSGTLRQCLLHGDAELRTNALTIVATMECYDQVATLLQILEQKEDPLQDDACRTLQDLTNRLCEQSLPSPNRKSSPTHARNIPQVRQNVLAALDGACNRFEQIAHGREVVECALALGDPDNHAVRKILLQSASACRQTAADLLMTSKHPGVLRLLMDFMGQNYPVVKAVDAFEKRGDPEFVVHVLGTFPAQLSENQQKNFKQLSRMAWIEDELVPLETIPPNLHESLVAFVQATNIDNAYKTDVQKWILMRGSSAARAAAGRVLEVLSPNAVRGLLVGSLESEDENVQAWATTQLRSQGVPEAIRLLMERLDSPLPAVREAARGELGGFNLELMLNIFDHLDHSICLRAGALMRKIDPDCVRKLLDELKSPIRRRRIRAARAAEALELAAEVQSGLIAMLSDQDTLVRRTAAEVLVSVPTPEVVAGLAELLNDPSPRAREAAEHSLEELRRAGFRDTDLEAILVARHGSV